ncbi:hypothetical protein ACJIZ3_001011 [Penstemon smallii]|uniref:TF-B3 domain-containing protein n=1 Tax=Penstemon smallii TaxID=265156 RepID=A0ABD3U4T8_9LAMI
MKKKNTRSNEISISKKPKIHKSEAEQAGRYNDGSHTIWSSAMERAEEVSANLSPSFLKPVQRSNVAGRFCVYLPKQFCDVHLPNHDDTIVLMDEDEREYLVKYVLLRNKLDGGWRSFSNVNKLMEGDVLVFHLIARCKFKVYVVRPQEVHGLIGPPNSVDPIYTDGTGNKRDKHGHSVPGSIRSSRSAVDFEDVKCFEDFQISVDGLILDSEIPRHLREKYHVLCCSQEMFLHDHLIEGFNSMLVIGIISETTSIADAIRAANLSTSLKQLKIWDKTLEALEELGMWVKFLRVRLRKLVRLACKSNEIVDSKKRRIAQLDDDYVSLKKTVLKAKVSIKGLEAEVEDLEVKKEKLSFEFKKLACAPW